MFLLIAHSVMSEWVGPETQVFSRTAAYNMRVNNFFAEMLKRTCCAGAMELFHF
jgi:hypothetical protein